MSVIMLITECSTKTRQERAFSFQWGKKASPAFTKPMTGALASLFFSPGWESGEKRERRQRKGFRGGETKVGEGREEDGTATE